MRSVRQLIGLAGRKALVTGAAGHIGSAVSQTLADLGATVAVLDADGEACERRAAALRRRRRGSAIGLPCDLRDEAQTRSAVDAAARRMRGLDILVHCAGYVGSTGAAGWTAPFNEQTVQAWDAAMRVNATAAFVMAQQASRALARSGCGSVILFSSIYGVVAPDWRLYEGTGMANPLGYGASKGALLQLTRYLATTLAPRIRVNAISPGGVSRRQPASFQRRYVARTPLGRMASEEDLMGAVVFLASDLSAYVTGHNLVVDGGWTIW
jgi:NAD(P)-dependent dehydrogenase (short-subunit alcohol dehydrogenase family)